MTQRPDRANESAIQRIMRHSDEDWPHLSEAQERQAEAELVHRRALEVKRANLHVFQTVAGQISAIVFALSALGVTAYSAYVGAQWIGSILGGGVIVGGILALRGRTPPAI